MQLYSEKATSEILACTVSCLRRMRRERRGPRFVRLGRLIRYSEADLQKFIEASTENVIPEKRRLAVITT